MQPEAHRQRRMVTDWTQKPHIVLWLVDDQGWANAGWNNQHVYTPRMDTMAKVRAICDEAESLIPPEMWTLATYKELLFLDSSYGNQDIAGTPASIELH